MSKFTHIAHVCALMLSAHSHVMAMEALPSAATIEIIGSSTTIRNQVQGEIKDFLDDLGRGSFSFSDVATETPQLMRERIVAALGISRDSSTMNSYIHMQTLKNLWGKTHHEGVIYSMIDIVKRLDLRDEARDLYFLSAFMLMSRGLTTSPVELKLASITYPIEEDDKYPGIKEDIVNISQRLSTDLFPFLSHYAHRVFIQSPFLRNKMALLFPENKNIPLHTAHAIIEGVVDYDENGVHIKTESERYKAAARLYLKSNNPYSLHNLGVLIRDHKVNEDEDGGTRPAA